MRKQAVLYCQPYGVSARVLASALGLKARRSTRRRVAVTWGAGATEGLNHQIPLSKLHQLRTWTEAGLSTLPYSLTQMEGWLGRSGGSHGGMDFLPHRTFSPEYWTQPLKSQAEYRVHLCRLPDRPRGNPSSYRVIRFGWKTNTNPPANRIVEGVHIKSRQYGWTLRYYAKDSLRSSIPSSLNLLCRWAIASLEWDFGAVDVLRVNGRFVLVEANSCPSLLDNETANAYADAIKEHLDA